VFPVTYELDVFMLFRRNSVFRGRLKVLGSGSRGTWNKESVYWLGLAAI
jgi:hypothetical protein